MRRLAAAPALAVLCCAGAHALTLDEVMAIAYERDPGLVAQRAALRAADEEIPAALSGYRPSVDLEAGAGFSHSHTNFASRTLDQSPNNVALTVTQPIYHGGLTDAQIDKAHNDIESASAKLVTAEQDVLGRVATDYVAAIHANRLIEVIGQHQKQLEDWSARVRDMMKAGELSQPDVDEAEASVARAKALRVQAEGQLAAARSQLQRDCGERPDQLAPVAALANLPATREQAESWASSQNPRVIDAEYQHRAAEADIDAIDASFLPRLDLQAGVERGHDEFLASAQHGINHDRVDVMLQLTWPIYDGGLRNAHYRQASRTAERKQAEAADARAAVIQDAGVAWDRLHAATLEIAARGAEREARARALSGILELDRIQQRTPHEVGNAFYSYLVAEIAELEAISAEPVYEFQLAAAIGRLTAAALNLNVPALNENGYLPQVRNLWWGEPENQPPPPTPAPINEATDILEQPPTTLRQPQAVALAPPPPEPRVAAYPVEPDPSPIDHDRQAARREERRKYFEFGSDE